MARGPFRSAADVDGPCISVTGVDGQRVYCSMLASASGREHSLRSQYHGGQLTKDSMHILLELVSTKSHALYLLASFVAFPMATQAGSLTCQSNAQDRISEADLQSERVKLSVTLPGRESRI